MDEKKKKIAKIKKEILLAINVLFNNKIASLSWCSISMIDRNNGLIFYLTKQKKEKVKISDVFIIDIDGKVVTAKDNYVGDILLHLAIYKANDNINAVVRSNIAGATLFCQLGASIPSYINEGKSLYFPSVPCTRNSRLHKNKEDNIIHSVKKLLMKTDINALIVKNDMPLVFGKDIFNAINNTILLESVANLVIVREMFNQIR